MIDDRLGGFRAVFLAESLVGANPVLGKGARPNGVR